MMDRKAGVETKQLLCLPIHDKDNEPVGAIQVINPHHGMSWTDKDYELLNAFRVYIQIAAANEKATAAEQHAVHLARQAISIATKMSWTNDAKDLLSLYFDNICESTDCSYISLSMPPIEGKVLRYDNYTLKPYVVPLRTGTVTERVITKHKFMNVTITSGLGSRDTRTLETKDNYRGARREWIAALPDAIDPTVHQGSATTRECDLKDRVDVNRQLFEEHAWSSILFIPIVTTHGTFMLQVAGKRVEAVGAANRFTLLDEELLVLSGQQFVHMVTQFDLLRHMNGLLQIMTVDANDISLGFLSDKVVELSVAQRGTIFVIDGDQLYFMVDIPTGEKIEIRIPLTRKSLAGAAILDNEIINIPDCYADDRFDPAMDKKTGFHTAQMLCVPIDNAKGEVIGAIQIINTEHGTSWVKKDVELLHAFKVYIQLAILNKKKAGGLEDKKKPPPPPPP